MNLLDGLMPLASDTAAIWIASILAQITGVVMLATVTARTWARFHPALRHGIWLGSLLAVLASPLLAAASIQGDWSLVRIPLLAERPAVSPDASAPAEPVGVPPMESPIVLPTGTPTEIDLETPVVESRPVAPEAVDLAPVDLAPSVPEAPFDAPRSLFTLFLGVWLAGSLFLAARLVHGAWVLAKLRHEVQPADGLAEALGLVGRRFPDVALPRIVVSDSVHGPVAAGLWNPIVIVPVELAEQLSPAALADILMHECAHLVERHPWSGFLSRVAVMLFWPHPLVHYLASQLARAREEVCDNYVLSAGSPTGYARTLLALAPRLASPGPHPAAALGLLQPTWKLEDRVAGLLNPRRKTMIRVPRWQALTVVATLAVVALGVAATRFVNAEESPSADSALAFADDTKKPKPLAEVAVVADSLHLPLKIVDRFDYVDAITKPLALPALTISEEPQNDRAAVASSFASGTFKPASPRAGKSTVAWLASPPISGGFDWRPVAVTREGNRITLHVEEWTDSVRRLQNHLHQTVHALSLGVLPAETYEFRIQVQTMFWDAANKARHYEDTKLVQGSIKIKLGETPAENVPLPSLAVKDLEPRDMLAKPVPRTRQNPRPIHAELFSDVTPEAGVRVGTFDLAAWQKLPGKKGLPELKPPLAGEPVYAVVVGPQFNLYESMRLASIEWIDQRAILRLEMWRDDAGRRKNYNFYPMTIVPLQSHEGESFRGGDYQADLEWTLMYALQPGGVATASTRDQIVQRGGEPHPLKNAFASFVAGAANSTKFSMPAKQAAAGRAALDDTKPDQVDPKITARFVQAPKPIAWQIPRGKAAPSVTVGTFDAAAWEKLPNPKELPEVKPPAAGEPVFAVIVGPQLNLYESMRIDRIEWTDGRAVLKMQLRRDDGERSKNAVFVPVIAVPLEPQGKAQVAAGDYQVELDWTLLYSAAFQGAVTTYTREQILKLGAEVKPAQQGFAEFAGKAFHKAAFSVPGAAKQAAGPSARSTDLVAAAPEPKEGKLAPADVSMQLEAPTQWTAGGMLRFRCIVTNNTSKAITFPGWGLMDISHALEVVDPQGQTLKIDGGRDRTAPATAEMFPTIEAGKSHVFTLAGRVSNSNMLVVSELMGGVWHWNLTPDATYTIRATASTEGKAEEIKKRFVFARVDNLWTGKARSAGLKVTLSKPAEAKPAEEPKQANVPAKRLTEIARAAAPDPAPAKIEQGVTMHFEGPADWTTGGAVEFQCLVKNNTEKPIFFPIWDMMGLGPAIEVLDAAGKVVAFEGGNNRGPAIGPAMFTTIQAGKSQAFKLTAQVDAENKLVVRFGSGGIWWWKLAPGKFTVRAVARVDDKALGLNTQLPKDQADILWTGRIRSNDLKVTLAAAAGKAGEPKQAALEGNPPARASLVQKFNELAKAPEGNAPAIPAGDLSMELAIRLVDWTPGGKMEFQCTVKNSGKQAVVFPAWGMMDVSRALEIVNSDGKALELKGMRDATRMASAEMFPTIEAGKSHVFKLPGQTDANSVFAMHEVRGGSWSTGLAPGPYTIRAVTLTEGKADVIKKAFKFAQVDNLWTGTLRSNEVKVQYAVGEAKVGANDPPKADGYGPEAQGLRSRVSLEKAKFAVGEKILVAYEIKNVSDKPQTVWHSGFWPNHMIVVIDTNGKEPELTPRGKEVRAAFKPAGARDKNVPVEIAPGKEDKAWGKYDITELYVLTKPGKYAVQYVYEEGVKLQSNWAPFEIAGP